MPKIYLLYGEVYEDHEPTTRWNLKAYTNLPKANDHLLNVQLRAGELLDNLNKRREKYFDDEKNLKPYPRPRGKNAFDPEMWKMCSESLPTYTIEAVELI